MTDSSNACASDLNGDGAVNVPDILVLLSAFAQTPAGDVNGDGITNVPDLLVLLGYFGNPC